MHVTATALRLPFYCGPSIISIDLAGIMYGCCTCSLASMKLAVVHMQTIRNHKNRYVYLSVSLLSTQGALAHMQVNTKSYADKALDSKHG